MGCGASKVKFTVNSKDGQDEIAALFFDMICLAPGDVDTLYSNYLDIDLADKGTISTDDLYYQYRLEECDFLRKLFSAGNNKNKQRLLFLDYVALMWNFLSLDEGQLPALIYFLYDNRGSDCMDVIEIKKMMECVHQKKYDASSAVRNMTDNITDKFAQMSAAQFMGVCKKNPSVCAPILSTQFNLRKIIGGDLFWNKISQKRHGDLRMSKIGFPYQCQKDCEATREQEARELRLSSLSKEKKSSKSKSMNKSSSESKIERSNSAKILAVDDNNGDEIPAKVKRQKSKKNFDDSAKLERSKSKSSFSEDGEDEGKINKKRSRTAKSRKVKPERDNEEHLQRQPSGQDLTDSPTVEEKRKKTKKSKSKKKLDLSVKEGDDDAARGNSEKELSVDVASDRRPLKLDPIKKKSKSKKKL